MWFGDLVTMALVGRPVAERVVRRVPGHPGHRRGDPVHRRPGRPSRCSRKAWGYAADQRPSTHPVAPTEVADTALALLNFDGISYAKGAAVLRQLVAWVGDEAFLAGLQRALRRARVRQRHPGRPARRAVRRQRPGPDRLGRGVAAPGPGQHAARRGRAGRRRPLRRGGRRADRAARASDAAAAPARRRPLRPAPTAVRCCAGGSRSTWIRRVDGGRTPVPALTGEPAADLLLLNDGDLTYAKVRLDDDSAAAVPLVLPVLARLAGPRGGLGRDAGRGRATASARSPSWSRWSWPRCRSRPRSSSSRTCCAMTRGAGRPLPRPGRPGRRRWRMLAQACDRLLAGGPAGRLPAAGRRPRADRRDRRHGPAARLAGRRRTCPTGLAVDADLRWLILYRLVVLGAAGRGRDRRGAGARTAAPPASSGRPAAGPPVPDAGGQGRRLGSDHQRTPRCPTGWPEAHRGGLLAAGAAGADRRRTCERYFADMPAMTAARDAG